METHFHKKCSLSFSMEDADWINLWSWFWRLQLCNTFVLHTYQKLDCLAVGTTKTLRSYGTRSKQQDAPHVVKEVQDSSVTLKICTPSVCMSSSLESLQLSFSSSAWLCFSHHEAHESFERQYNDKMHYFFFFFIFYVIFYFYFGCSLGSTCILTCLVLSCTAACASPSACIQQWISLHTSNAFMPILIAVMFCGLLF